MKRHLSLGIFIGAAAAQSGAWGQCGGIGWSGPTTCISGYTCTFQNDWYSQCLPGSAPTTLKSTTSTKTTTSTSTKTTTTTTTTTAATTTTTQPTTSATGTPGNFRWLGVDESGAEFGTGTYPGTYGKDFIFPDNNSLKVLLFRSRASRHHFVHC